MTALTATQISIQPEDFIHAVHGALKTTSLKVAEAFGKRHRDVLRKIDTLDCPSEFTCAHFCADVQTVNLGQGAKRESRVIEMDKDGFMFLVMGFTGQKAAQIKVAYINAFNWMAEKLSRAPSRTPTNVEDRKPLNRAVRTLANLRSAQGKSADYGGMWKLVNGYLGLATIEDATPEQLDRAMVFVQDSIEHETRKIMEGEWLGRSSFTPMSQRQQEKLKFQIHRAHMSNYLREASSLRAVHNRLKVQFHLHEVANLPAERFEEAMDMLEGQYQATNAFNSAVRELGDAFIKEVLNGGEPWTPWIKRQLGGVALGAHPDWRKLARQISQTPSVQRHIGN